MLAKHLSWSLAGMVLVTSAVGAADPVLQSERPADERGAAEPEAATPAWSVSFAGEALVAHHRPESILVVGAGEGDEGLEAAARALAVGYRAAGVGLVMDASGLGDVAALDDAEIVERAAGLPVAEVAVLRVFAGASGEAPRAVVTVYRAGGELVTAFSTVAGEALPEPAARAEDEEASVGVSAEVVERVMQSEPEPAIDAQASYDGRFISFDHVYVKDGNVVRRFTVAYRGTQRDPLSGADFYEVLGRSDLAASYRRRRNLRIGAMVVSGAAAVGGLLLYLRANDIRFADCYGDPDFEQCDAMLEAEAQPYYVGSYVAIGVSAVTGLFAWLYPTHPIYESEARELAAEYNENLRKELGLSGRRAAKMRRTRPSIRVAPYASADGAGIGVVGRF